MDELGRGHAAARGGDGTPAVSQVVLDSIPLMVEGDAGRWRKELVAKESSRVEKKTAQAGALPTSGHPPKGQPCSFTTNHHPRRTLHSLYDPRTTRFVTRSLAADALKMLDPALKNEAAILHSYVKEGKLVEEGLLIDPRTTSYDDAIALVTKHKPWGIPPGSSFNFKIKHTTPAGDHSVYLCVTPGVWGRHECMYLDVILPSTTVDQPSNEQETPAVIVLAPEAAPPTPASERPTSPAPGPSRRRSSTTPVREEEESSATPEDEEEEIEIVPQTPDSSDTEEMVATTGRFNALEKGKGRAQSRTSSRETLAALADGPLDEAARVASSSQSSTSANGPLPLSQQQPLFLPPLTSSLGSSTHSHRKATSPSPRDSAPSPQPPAGKGPSPSETSAFNTSRLASETPSWHVGLTKRGDIGVVDPTRPDSQESAKSAAAVKPSPQSQGDDQTMDDAHAPPSRHSTTTTEEGTTSAEPVVVKTEPASPVARPTSPRPAYTTTTTSGSLPFVSTKPTSSAQAPLLKSAKRQPDSDNAPRLSSSNKKARFESVEIPSPPRNPIPSGSGSRLGNSPSSSFQRAHSQSPTSSPPRGPFQPQPPLPRASSYPHLLQTESQPPAFTHPPLSSTKQSSKAPRRRSMNPTGSNNAQRDKEKRDKLKNAPRPDPPLLARSPRWHLYLRLPNEDQGPNNRGMQGLFRERHNWCEIRPIALGGKTGDCTIWTIFQVAARETGWDVTQFKLRTLMETSDGKRTLEFDGRVPEHRDAAKGTTLENWGLATSGGLIDLDCFE